MCLFDRKPDFLCVNVGVSDVNPTDCLIFCTGLPINHAQSVPFSNHKAPIPVAKKLKTSDRILRFEFSSKLASDII